MDDRGPRAPRAPRAPREPRVRRRPLPAAARAAEHRQRRSIAVGVWQHALRQVLQETGDVAKEETWQKLAVLLAQNWHVFEKQQSPISSWSMLTKCTETILKIRMIARRDQGGEDALGEFRAFMGEVWQEGEVEETVKDG